MLAVDGGFERRMNENMLRELVGGIKNGLEVQEGKTLKTVGRVEGLFVRFPMSLYSGTYSLITGFVLHTFREKDEKEHTSGGGRHVSSELIVFNFSDLASSVDPLRI